MTHISQSLVPVYGQAEEQRKARLLAILLICFGVFAAIGFIVPLFLSASLTVLAANGALLLLVLVCYGLLRGGRLRWATILFLGGWVTFTVASLLPPAIPPLQFLIMPYILCLAIISAGMLLTPHSSFVVAAAVVVLLLVAVAVRGGWDTLDLPETREHEGTLLAIPLAVTVVLAALSWLFGRDVTRAMTQMEKNAQALTAQLTANQALIVEITEAATWLAPTAEQLAATMEQINSGAEQIAATVVQMAQGAGAQARQAEGASHSTAQLAAATNQIADNARQTGDASTHAQELVQDSVRVVKALGDKLSEIERVVALVEKIADQTNLLALNASIEAARAGEHGAGFAVVADEVRRLAEHSASSVGEIGVLSREIGVRLEEVMATMAETQRAVERAATLAQETAAATKEQEEASETMVGAVNEMATVAEESAAASEQIAASVEEQVVSIEQVANTTRMLAELAGSLQQTVSEFTVNSGLICPNFAACPVFERFSAEESKQAYVNQYCEGHFEECERKKREDAGDQVPPALLPDDSYWF